MKGHVEIFKEVDGKKTVIHKDCNLIVDGAGEAIVDMLTFTPAIALSGSESDFNDNTYYQNALDASNFIIQGMSFAKGRVGYKSNLHKYKAHNLIASANLLKDISIGYTSSCTVLERPNKYIIDGISTVFDINSLDIDQGGSVTLGNNVFDQDYIHSTSGLPKVFSIDVKMDLNNPPVANVDVNNAPQPHHMTIEVSSGGDLLLFTSIWVSPGRHNGGQFIGGNLFAFVNDSPRGTTLRPCKALYKELGFGWYRILCSIPSVTSYSSEDFHIKIYPAGSSKYESTLNRTNLSGKMMFARPSLNVGSLPVNYFLPNEGVTTSSTEFNSGFQITTSSIISKESSYALPNYLGTITNSANGYNVSASLPNTPHPNDTLLESDTSTDYQDHVDVNLPNGHNLNTFPLVAKLEKNIMDFLPSYWVKKGGDIQKQPIQKDFRWFGCYADDRNNTAILVDEISVDSFNSPISTRISSGDRFNTVSSMDYKGYLHAYYASNGETSNSSQLLVSALPDFSSTGKVIYSVKINRADVEMANYFGGIFDLGLHSLDQKSTRKNNQIGFSRSIDLDPWSGDDVEFKLFAQKSMNYDITHSDDFTAANSVTINWTIDFL